MESNNSEIIELMVRAAGKEWFSRGIDANTPRGAIERGVAALEEAGYEIVKKRPSKKEDFGPYAKISFNDTGGYITEADLRKYL